jgi:hypothetical protein
MPANNSNGIFHYLSGKYPGKIMNMFTPFSWQKPKFYIPYVIDNGAYTYYKNEQEFDDSVFYNFILKVTQEDQKPLWIAVPDVVTKREETIVNWYKWEKWLKQFNIPLAFVVQDGMSYDDIPKKADLLFIGGSTKWKLDMIPYWTKKYYVHVGRVNTEKRIKYCYHYGVKSIDGTGLFYDKVLFFIRNFLEMTKKENDNLIQCKDCICWFENIGHERGICKRYPEYKYVDFDHMCIDGYLVTYQYYKFNKKTEQHNWKRFKETEK